MTTTRASVISLGIQATTPFAALVGIYLLFAGHNNPGGGFAAGLVFGAVIALRIVVGLQQPTQAGALLATGVLIVAAVAVAPLLWGGGLLDQFVVDYDVPLLGKVKSGSALPFDIGVTAIVVGLVVALLDGLGGTALAAEPTPTHRGRTER